MNQYLETIVEISHTNKYTRWYVSIIEQAISRATTKTQARDELGYSESHHILPRCFALGGETDSVNIAHLSGREHFICHLLLTKMFDGPRYYQMLSPLALFKTPSKNHAKRNFKLNSWEYEKVKKAAAEAARFNASREVSIDGVLYSSAKLARRLTKIPNLHHKLHSIEYPQYYYTDGLTEKVSKKPDKMKYKYPVTIDGVWYESTESARRELGLTRGEVDARFKDINWPGYVMEGVEKTVNRIPREQRKRSVIIEGVEYSSVNQATKALNLHPATMKSRLKSKYWITWYYAGNPKEDTGITGYQAISQVNSKPVIVNGISYESVKAAASLLRLQEVEVSRRCRSDDYLNYGYLADLSEEK